jgi:hypothetical protein
MEAGKRETVMVRALRWIGLVLFFYLILAVIVRILWIEGVL